MRSEGQRTAASAAGAVGGTIVITLVLLEAALRVITRSGTLRGFPLCPIDPAAPVRAARGIDFATAYLVFDAELGWVVGPARRSRNGLYESTSFGARRVGPGPDPVPGEPVFALSFGDSFTHGDDVAPEGTWQHALAVALGRGVVDFGVPGYGADQALLRYRRLEAEWPSRVVLIGLMADNIARHVNRYRPFLSPEETIFFAKPRFELADAGDGLRLTREPFEHLDDYFGPDFDTELPSLARDDPSYEPGWYRSSLIDAWRTARVLRTVRVLREARAPRWRRLYEDGSVVELTRRIVSHFVAAVRADGRQAIVVFFPDRTFLEDTLAGREHLAIPLLRRLTMDGIDVVDTTPALADFVREGHPLGEELIPHYSAGMNARVAARLAARLRELRSPG